MTGGSGTVLRLSRAHPQATLIRLFAGYFREVWGWLGVLGVPHHALRDATRDVFVEAWCSLDGLEAADTPRRALFAIAANVAQEYQSRLVEPSGAAAPRGAPGSLDRYLAPLTDGERVVFLLFELGGLSSEQIAELTGTTPVAVATRLRAARACVESTAAREPPTCP